MQQGVQNGTVLGAVGQQSCVHLQRSFINQSYSVKKSTNNVKISLINYMGKNLYFPLLASVKRQKAPLRRSV